MLFTTVFVAFATQKLWADEDWYDVVWTRIFEYSSTPPFTTLAAIYAMGDIKAEFLTSVAAAQSIIIAVFAL